MGGSLEHIGIMDALTWYVVARNLGRGEAENVMKIYGF